MPPRKFSRHTFTIQSNDGEGRQFLSDRRPYGFKPFTDNILHTVREGDTLFSLAAQYYYHFERPNGLWWVIGDFQPQPVHDPTLKLEIGSVIILPSSRTVEERILSERRRWESDA